MTMRQNILAFTAISVVMLLFPLCAVTFIDANAGMLVCFLLFFAVNPIAAVLTGIFSGISPRTRWFLPLTLSVFFIIGAWAFLAAGERAFCIYGVAYLILGYASALITHTMRKNRA